MPKTFVTTVRLDIEDVATIAAFLTQHHIRILHRTTPITEGIKMISNIIRENHPSTHFTIKDATDFLVNAGIDVRKNNRGVRQLTKCLQAQELEYYTERGNEIECRIDNPTQEIKKSKKRREDELAAQIEGFKSVAGLVVADE